MTHVFEDAESFAETSVRGYCTVHGRVVRAVTGGVLRSTVTPQGKVALVTGGGGGHYPAFAGYVGAGLADAAVTGDVFASPATRLIASVARKAERGAGIMLVFGNYAGDALNFRFAAEQLRSEGIGVCVLAITDDIASASPEQHGRRRGTAGDIPVLKIVGAAAEAGLSLDEVERLAHRANAYTRSLGVAFGGCTLPGTSEPLFSVPSGRMAIGLGIHGEPGIEETAILPASELAKLLVGRLLAEAPVGASGRAAVLLNGLGSTKHEELFVLWTYVADELTQGGITTVSPLVGEYITSLDMEGCSLTLTWLDEELESYWQAPCDTAALRVGNTASAERAVVLPDEGDVRRSWRAAPPDAQEAGQTIALALSRLARTLKDAEAELGRIDALAGDGDHGQGMARGSRAAAEAAREAAEAGAGAASVLAAAADAWAARAGGTAGVIWGLGLQAISSALDDKGKPTLEQARQAATSSLDAVTRLGGARPGDKTLVDAFAPFVETLVTDIDADQPLKVAWAHATERAFDAANATADLLPKLGRARTHEERSRGHRDAGAVSFALAARTVSDTINEH